MKFIFASFVVMKFLEWQNFCSGIIGKSSDNSNNDAKQFQIDPIQSLVNIENK